MEDEPDLWTLWDAWHELLELHRDYPAEGPERERAEYFAAALERGLEIHRACGSPEEEALERIGLAAGASGTALRHWIRTGQPVHPQFHQGALLAQASLVEDRIKACRAALAKITSHLEADDYRAELTAFDHLKTSGIEALRDNGGELGRRLAEKFDGLGADRQADLDLGLRRLALQTICRALGQLINEPSCLRRGMDADAAENGRDSLN